MELMPHVKALLDDLVSITKNMTVKRSDLVIANENDDDTENSNELYYIYKKIMDGELDYSSCIKSDIPYNVLSNIYKWESQDNTNSYNLTPDDCDVYSGNKTIFIRNKCDSNMDGPEKQYMKKLGDIYIRQNLPINKVSGSFVKLYKNNNSYRYTSVSLYNAYTGDTTGLTEDSNSLGIYRDQDGHIMNSSIKVEPIIDSDNRIIFYDENAIQKKLYVEDLLFSKVGRFFREVRYKRDEEYILKSDVIESFDSYITADQNAEGFTKAITIIESDKNDYIGRCIDYNGKYITLTSDNIDLYLNIEVNLVTQELDFYLEQLAVSSIDADYVFYGGFADKNYEESQSYIYDSDGSKIIEYVFDNDFGRYRLKKDTGEDDNLEVYYKRSFNEYYLVDGDADPYVYVEKYMQVPYYYDKVDDVDYYEVSMPITSEEDENGIIQTEKTGIYEIADNLTNDLDLENAKVYTKYYNNKAGMIDVSETFIDSDGVEKNRYKLMTKKSSTSMGDIIFQSVITYTLDENRKETEVIVDIDKITDTDEYYEYYLENEYGSFEFKDGRYIYSDNNESTKYSKTIKYDPYFYKYNEETREYSPGKTGMTDYIDGETYTYINNNLSVYSVERLFSDDDIVSIWNNEYNMPEEFESIIIDGYSEYIKDKYAPLRESTDWGVTRYDGETNAYYRALNGLPPLSDMYNQPKIDRLKINEEYDGDDVNPYLYNLTDTEVDTITSNGMLKNFMKLYPNSDYLRHIGRNRIDVCKAREAGPFEILTYGKYLNEEHMILFSDAYKVSKNYVIHNYYKPEMFAVNEYYGSYIAMLILVHALQICAAKSGDILIHNKYSDYETVQLKLKSFGFENTFEHIPLVYRKNIAKNIELLIKNKGIDNIYEIVYKIFGIDDVEVYKYYFRKLIDENGNSNLSISQVPISSENVVRDIINTDNTIDYDTVTNGDRYWGVYEPKSNIKDMLKDYPFNYMNSKYITLNNKFNLSKLNFSSSYYLNYVQEILSKNNIKFMISIDGFDNPISLKNLIIMLFAIQSIKYGFDGNIPSDIASTSAILKFNLSDEVTITGDEALTKSKLIDIIDQYYNYMSNRETVDTSGFSDEKKYIYEKYDKLESVSETEKYWRGKGKAYNIKNNILNPPKPPIVLPEEMTDVTALDTISQAYLDNLSTDNTLTNSEDEGSLYQTILRYRDDSKTYNDYMCFNTLGRIISISKIVKENFKIPSVWELIAEVDVAPDEDGIMTYNFKDVIDEDGNVISKCWKYTDMQRVWVPIDIDEFITSIPDTYDGNIVAIDGVYICNDTPEPYKALQYEYALNVGDIERGELKDILIKLRNKETIDKDIKAYKPSTIFPENIPIRKGNGTNDANLFINYLNNYDSSKIVIANGDKIYYSDKTPENYVLDNDRIQFKSGTYYFKPEIIDNPLCKVKVYRLSDYAYTYEMYLKYMEPSLYNYLQLRDSEDKTSYLNRLNELFSIIIASIENSITNNSVRDSLSLSLVDFANIAKYIKIVIEVFKSYTIDLSSMDAIYSIDDKSQNRIKYIDDISVNEKSYMSSNINMHSTTAFDENLVIPDAIGFNDEIIIESIKEVK